MHQLSIIRLEILGGLQKELLPGEPETLFRIFDFLVHLFVNRRLDTCYHHLPIESVTISRYLVNQSV